LRESVVLPAPGDIKVIERKRYCGKPEVYLPFKPEGDDQIAPLADYGSSCIFHITSSMHGYKGYSQNDPANASFLMTSTKYYGMALRQMK
jgi:2-oxoglutarate ferredoxin oxidoreductase subunit alpha